MFDMMNLVFPITFELNIRAFTLVIREYKINMRSDKAVTDQTMSFLKGRLIPSLLDKKIKKIVKSIYKP